MNTVCTGNNNYLHRQLHESVRVVNAYNAYEMRATMGMKKEERIRESEEKKRKIIKEILHALTNTHKSSEYDGQDRGERPAK